MSSPECGYRMDIDNSTRCCVGRDGPVNAKRVCRLYREEGLVLRRKRPKRRRSAAIREQSCAPSRANERWAMDFVHDTLSGGGRMRVLAVIDVYTRVT